MLLDAGRDFAAASFIDRLATEPEIGWDLVDEVQRLPKLPKHSKKLLGAPGLTTRSKDATRGSWHRY